MSYVKYLSVDKIYNNCDLEIEDKLKGKLLLIFVEEKIIRFNNISSIEETLDHLVEKRYNKYVRNTENSTRNSR